MIRLEFEQKSEDLYTFFLFDGWNDPDKKTERRKTKWVPALFLLLIMYMIARYHGIFRDSERLIGFSLLAAFSAFVMSWLSVAWVKAQIKQKYQAYEKEAYRSGFLGPKVVEFKEDGILIVTPKFEKKESWYSLLKMKTYEGYYFLYLNSGHKLIIPLRAFEDEVQRIAFLKQVQSKLNGMSDSIN